MSGGVWKLGRWVEGFNLFENVYSLNVRLLCYCSTILRVLILILSYVLRL